MSGTSEKLVSVVITTRNRCELLKRAIESVLNQTYRNIELIIIDDNSSDNTQELVRSSTGKIIYVRHNKCMGGAASRMTGSQRANGEYIAFLDDDDQWEPEKIEKQINVAKGAIPDCAVITCGAKIFLNECSEPTFNMPRINGNIRQILICLT